MKSNILRPVAVPAAVSSPQRQSPLPGTTSGVSPDEDLEPSDSSLAISFFDSPEQCASAAGYASDESKLDGGPVGALARPQSTAQVSQAVLELARRGFSITTSGARTGVVGGAVCQPMGAVVSLERMKRISDFQVSSDGLTSVRVQAGVSLQELSDFLDEHHPEWFFPVDPTERSASFGGMVSTNAGGARTYRYGALRPWVLGLEVVLATGGVLKLHRGNEQIQHGTLVLEDIDREGARAGRELNLASEIAKPQTKNALGYQWSEGSDALDVFVGAEGTLGIVTEITLRLERRPEGCLYVLSFFRDEDSALEYVEALDIDPLLKPLAIEFCDSNSLRFVEHGPSAANLRVAASLTEALRAAVYTEIAFSSDDDAPDGLESTVDALHRMFLDAGGQDGETIAGFGERDLRDMRAFRHAVPEACNAKIAARKAQIPGLHKIATDMAVPKSERKTVFELYRSKLTEEQFEFAIFGHAGDAHFHVNILPRSTEELQRAKELYHFFAKEIVALNGAVSAEHGVGRIKSPFLHYQYGAEQLSEMRAIKAFFDPSGLFNPGVLL